MRSAGGDDHAIGAHLSVVGDEVDVDLLAGLALPLEAAVGLDDAGGAVAVFQLPGEFDSGLDGGADESGGFAVGVDPGPVLDGAAGAGDDDGLGGWG